MKKKIVAALLATLALPLAAQDAQKQIERYRELLADGNPAELLEMRGEDLWKQKRGPKNASMEACDLGLSNTSPRSIFRRSVGLT